jgi:hypothetical protein
MAKDEVAVVELLQGRTMQDIKEWRCGEWI